MKYPYPKRTAILTIICGIIGFISLVHTLITYNGITGLIAALCFIEIYTYGIYLTLDKSKR